MMRRIVVLGLALSVFALGVFRFAFHINPSTSADVGRAFEKARLSDHVTIRVRGRGAPLISLADGRDVISAHTDPAGAEQLLVEETARPLALTAADMDEDGLPDLITSYAAGDRGFLTVYRGNVDSLFPNTAEARLRRASGEFTDSPFLAPARIFQAPSPPEFLTAGDFDADGHSDLAVASSQSNL
ncbi:MAG TPA: VCBS repeat-containing protein, partial [Blastocatellia bacterium]|nr:VCBS repeat-containing protein [Blastocatellia bacterium]